MSLLANLKPEGATDIAHSLTQVAAMLRHASLVMIFSDLLVDPEPVVEALHRLRHRGHDVILFHILDEAEAYFPFDGMVELEEPESHAQLAHRRRRVPAGLPEGGGGLSRDVPAGVFSVGDRLRGPGHEHAVRQGPGRVPGPAFGAGVDAKTLALVTDN